MRPLPEARKRSVGAATAVLCALLSGPVTADTAEELRACLAANIPQKSSELVVRLLSRDSSGGESRHEGRILWRRSPEGRSESLICMSSPAPVRGLAYLISEGDSDVNMWGYLPEKERVLQIHLRGAARRARIARTAISHDDLRYLPMNLSGMEPSEITDKVIGDRTVSIVHLSLPPGEDVVYERVRSFVDRKTCVPLRTEFYEDEEKLLKVVTADPAEIIPVDGIHVASSLRVEDLKNQMTTFVRVADIRIDAGLPDDLFVPVRLQRNADRCIRLRD